MLRPGWVVLAVAILLGGGAFTWATEGPTIATRDLSKLTGNVTRGAYVARLSGCIACHTDAKGRGAVLAGGAEIATEFGSFYAPNITPHMEDGIGRWTLDDFSRALTQGRSPDGTHYFPAFPYPFYSRLSDQDVADLWAAVRSVPAVAGGPPPHSLHPPFRWQRPVGIWKRLYLDPEMPPSTAERSEKWRRGQYLAEAAGHCGACHTPRNPLGGRDLDRKFEGGIGSGDEKVPAITSEALKREGWTSEDLRYAFRSGLTPSGDSLGGSMSEVIREGTRYWNDQDIEALVVYLMDATQGD